MKTLGEAAIDLRWIAPGVKSLTRLAGTPLSAIWPELRNDPGCVLLLARSLGDLRAPSSLLDRDVPLLETALDHQPHFDTGFVDWNQDGPADIYDVCYRQALLASRL